MLLYRLAQLLVAATFVLLLIGGLVHGTGSGLACPDWPLCFGSAFPTMTGHVLYEHGHRLAAGTVALSTFALAIALAARRTSDRSLVRLGWIACGLVLVQAFLGALTVWLKLPAIVSTAHLAVSMLFFMLVIYLSVRLSPGWPERRTRLLPNQRMWLGAALLGLYLQILLGGLVRHTGSGLACIDIPLCHGSLLPLGEHPSVVLQAVHRLVALVVAGLVGYASWILWRGTPGPRLRLLAVLAPALVVLQITLGILSVLSFLELFRVTAHLGVAALLLAVVLLQWLHTLSGPSAPLAGTTPVVR